MKHLTEEKIKIIENIAGHLSELENGCRNKEKVYNSTLVKLVCKYSTECTKKHPTHGGDKMYEFLSVEIVVQSIIDYRNRPELRPEIETFLLSEWCDFLLQGYKMSGTEILNILKEEIKKCVMN